MHFRSLLATFGIRLFRVTVSRISKILCTYGLGAGGGQPGDDVGGGGGGASSCLRILIDL